MAYRVISTAQGADVGDIVTAVSYHEFDTIEDARKTADDMETYLKSSGLSAFFVGIIEDLR